MQKIKRLTPQINCPIFSEYEEGIKRLTRSINGHKIISKKVDSAQKLLGIINLLSSCPKYNEGNEDCESCRLVLNLRREIARIIVEASRISL